MLESTARRVSSSSSASTRPSPAQAEMSTASAAEEWAMTFRQASWTAWSTATNHHASVCPRRHRTIRHPAQPLRSLARARRTPPNRHHPSVHHRRLRPQRTRPRRQHCKIRRHRGHPRCWRHTWTPRPRLDVRPRRRRTSCSRPPPRSQSMPFRRRWRRDRRALRTKCLRHAAAGLPRERPRRSAGRYPPRFPRIAPRRSRRLSVWRHRRAASANPPSSTPMSPRLRPGLPQKL